MPWIYCLSLLSSFIAINQCFYFSRNKHAIKLILAIASGGKNHSIFFFHIKGKIFHIFFFIFILLWCKKWLGGEAFEHMYDLHIVFVFGVFYTEQKETRSFIFWILIFQLFTIAMVHVMCFVGAEKMRFFLKKFW